jgi:hypothetical protein
MGETTTLSIISQEQIHEFRKTISAAIRTARGFSNGYFKEVGSTRGKREIALVITKLQEAKMWCGKVLEEIGEQLPEEFRDDV